MENCILRIRPYSYLYFVLNICLLLMNTNNSLYLLVIVKFFITFDIKTLFA